MRPIGPGSAGREAEKEEPGPGVPLRHGQYHVFFGPLGLRAGWGIGLFFLLVSVLGVALVQGAFVATGQTRTPEQISPAARTTQPAAVKEGPALLQPKQAFTAEAAEASAAVLAAWGISFAERRRFGVYGLAARRLRDLLPGAACGLLCVALLTGVLWALHLLVFERQLLHGRIVLQFGAAWLATFLLVGVFEEFFFRGYLQFTLMRGLLGIAGRLTPGRAERTAFALAALVWSTLFSLTHLVNKGEDPAGIVMVFAAGLLFSYALWRTGALWWGVGFHMTWDWGQSFLFGVPDSGNLSAGRLFATHAAGPTLLSGGLAGPEGSVLVLPVLLLVAVVLQRYRRRPQPPVAPENTRLRTAPVAAEPIP